MKPEIANQKLRTVALSGNEFCLIPEVSEDNLEPQIIAQIDSVNVTDPDQQQRIADHLAHCWNQNIADRELLRQLGIAVAPERLIRNLQGVLNHEEVKKTIFKVFGSATHTTLQQDMSETVASLNN